MVGTEWVVLNFEWFGERLSVVLLARASMRGNLWLVRRELCVAYGVNGLQHYS
jgi:hypothetical protein